MSKSALAIAISLCIFAFAAPVAAAKERAAKPAIKKQIPKKSASKRMVVRRAPVMSASLNSRAKSARRVAYRPAAVAAPVYTAGDLAGLGRKRDPLALHSSVALVMDQNDSQVLFEKNANVALPMASLTKLMTALVVVEARQDMDEMLEISADDVDREKNTASRLRVGTRMTRANMLHIALMSSENRAASALGRHYPGGLPAFVAAMNAKAKALGMADTRYVDATGLSSSNVASARDLARLAVAAYQYPVIRQYSTSHKHVVNAGRYPLQYVNSNRLVNSSNWDIGLQKTGYIVEAGRCLIMQAKIDGRPVVMVFLDSKGKDSRLGDAGRIRRWMEATKPNGAPAGTPGIMTTAATQS